MKKLDETSVQRAHDAFKTIPFVQLVGMELVEIQTGKAAIRLKMRDALRQPHGLLHGGATASVIDTTTAFAVVSVLADGEKASTVDLTVHYLRPVFEGEILCTARIVRAGKRLLTVSAEVVSGEGKMIATALSTYSKV